MPASSPQANDGEAEAESSGDEKPAAPQQAVPSSCLLPLLRCQKAVAKKAVAKKAPAKKGGRKAKVPEHFEGGDAWQEMSSAERKQWLKENKPALSDEEVSAKKAAALEKRRATLAAKKAAAEAEETNQVIAAEPVSQEQAVVALDAIEVAQVLASKGEAPAPATAVELEEEQISEEEEEEELEVVSFEHGGKTYLKAADGVLYDQETQEPVGVWNC